MKKYNNNQNKEITKLDKSNNRINYIKNKDDDNLNNEPCMSKQEYRDYISSTRIMLVMIGE